jgi:hypothetical protein
MLRAVPEEVIAGGLMVFRVRGVCGGPELGISLSQQIFGSLGMAFEVLVVIVLGNVDLLICLYDVILSRGQIAVVMRIDVDDGRLGEGHSDAGEGYVEGCIDEQAFLCHRALLAGGLEEKEALQ